MNRMAAALLVASLAMATLAPMANAASIVGDSQHHDPAAAIASSVGPGIAT